MSIRIGVDTGGTFTDLVGCHSATGETYTLKTPSTPDDPGRAILNGLAEGARRGYWRLADIAAVVHGTTVATNTLLERRGARTVLVTTRGFRDVLAIQRQDRPRMYDLRSRRPEPLVPRELRVEITERTLADGRIETAIDDDELETLLLQLKELEPQAVVVGLLHSHVNPANERAIGEAVRKRLPGAAVTLSHEIAPEPGEFERFATAAANAYVQPVVEGYLERLQTSLESIGVDAPVFVMKSSGGVSAAQTVAKRCVETALSGPAGGVRACIEIAKRVTVGNLIAADMGGTSFDVAVVTAGDAQPAREASLGGLPLRAPMLDIHTIGAGGGSLAWVDAGGALRVGPESAGALPGPACYGRGGDRPTVTDANVVLGRLADGASLGGDTRLDRAAASTAIEESLAKPLGLTVQAAALGVLRVAASAMVAAIRKLTVERGVDPRRYALCPYGGAGPLHAAELAEELGVEEIILPATPGVFSACGLLLADLREDRSASFNSRLEAATLDEITATAARLAAEAEAELREGGARGQARPARQAVRLRYAGQTGGLPVGWTEGDTLSTDRLAEAFHAAHQQQFGFDRNGHPIEVVAVAVSVEVATPTIAQADRRLDKETTATESEREVWFAGEPVATRVLRRENLAADPAVLGPAVVEQADTTLVVPLGWRVTQSRRGELRMTRVEP